MTEKKDELLSAIIDNFFRVSCGSLPWDDDLYEWFDSNADDRLPSELFDAIDYSFDSNLSGINEELNPFTVNKIYEFIQKTKE